MRLILHTAAYWLMLTLRDAIAKAHALATAEFNTIRLRLLKLGARGCRDDFPHPPRLCCCLSGRHVDPPHRGCADADRAVNDGAPIAPVTRPENLQRLPKDQSPRRNRRLGASCSCRASVTVRLSPGTAVNKSG